MKISYKKLWHLLIEKNIKQSVMRQEAGICPNTLTRLINNKVVSLEVLYKICIFLNCNIGDIMEFEKEEGERKQ